MLAETEKAGKIFPSKKLVGAASPLVEYTVTVKNTGSVDADDVVLGFIKPPNAGEDGVPLQTLFGFERVHVLAGQSVEVNLYPELTDFTQVSLNGTRYALSGGYRIHFGVAETCESGQGYVEVSLALL